jgi:hypothetical protein
MDTALITVQEYADIHRVHVQTVYSAIRRNLLPYPVIRPTRRTIRIVVPRESIEERKSA